jgi:RNA polymerase sigma-70 factor (ECF subfamily)
MPALSMSMPMSEPTGWRRWLAQAEAANAATFEEIVEAHAALVLRTAQRLLLREADAQDAAQEVFLKLHRFASKFDESRDLRPWLFRMTVNVCHDLRRKRKLDLALENVPERAASEPTPEERWSAEERRQMLFSALAALTDREREAIVLRDLEGLTTAEVGEAMGTTEATVRSQIAMGRAKLKDFVKAQMGNRR